MLAEAKKWIPRFEKEVEQTLTASWKKLKAALQEAQLVAKRYNKPDSEVWVKGKAFLDSTMVMVSEALVVKALSSRDPQTEVALQLKRMSANKVGEICPVLMVACNRAVTKRNTPKA